jgi:hypothetical protein
VITDWCDDYLACRLCSIYLRLLRKAHFRAYTQRECGDLLRRSGFVDVVVERYKIDWLWGFHGHGASSERRTTADYDGERSRATLCPRR